MRSKNTTMSDDFGAGTVHTMHLYYFLVVIFIQMSNVESSDLPFLKHFFMKDNLVKKLFRMVFSFSLRKKVRIFLESILKQKSKPINKETRDNLVMFFKEDVSKLEQLLQINLKHWKE